MNAETLNEKITVKVPTEDRKVLQQLAARAHLKLADILREAIREYIARKSAVAAERETAAV